MVSFQSINNKFEQVFQLATKIWNDNYNGIISQKQIDYMLTMMYNSKRLQQDLNEGYKWEFIIYNNEIVGYLAYVIKNDRRVFLSKLYLKTEKQGLGIGKKALHRVINHAENNTISKVYLTVNKNNIKGIRAYKSIGFKIISEEITNIGNSYVMDDYVFEYQIY